MPGPSNIKKHNKKKSKGHQKSSIHSESCPHPKSPSPSASHHDFVSVLQTPYIYDPGNGPRVRDTQAFITSFFAQPPSLDDPLCAEFAQLEVCQMLRTVLPQETALILWYNKSRKTGRVCPSCRRLYRLGDVLPDHMKEEEECKAEPRSKELIREQEISGLCSPVCFILASFNYPGAIKSIWGRTSDEISSETWDLLNTPAETHGEDRLWMLVKMTRLEDLGLGQLCLPDVDFDDGYDFDSGHRHELVRGC